MKNDSFRSCFILPLFLIKLCVPSYSFVSLRPISSFSRPLMQWNPRNDTCNIDECSKPKKGAALVSTIAAASATIADRLTYLQTMTAGALSRSMAQTLLHPVHTYKTILQLRHGEAQRTTAKLTLERLFRGIDAQFVMSLPHGAFYFFVIDQVKMVIGKHVSPKFEFLADFGSSTVSTVICSVISTPQMVITDRLMAGVYPSFPEAVNSIIKADGMAGFYRGWWPALAQKIPSYGLTWMFFQQLKKSYEEFFHKKPNSEANFVLGALAAAGSVTVMIPMDTIKTRIVIQAANCPKNYKGVADCFFRILKEEGVGTFYRSLPPRLLAVVPMIAIQFSIYETLKNQFVQHNIRQRVSRTLRTQAVKAVVSARRTLTNSPVRSLYAINLVENTVEG